MKTAGNTVSETDPRASSSVYPDEILGVVESQRQSFVGDVWSVQRRGEVGVVSSVKLVGNLVWRAGPGTVTRRPCRRVHACALGLRRRRERTDMAPRQMGSISEGRQVLSKNGWSGL